MHELIKYTPIIFNGGSYGTYLNFVLSNLTTPNIPKPFDENGASHKFKSNWVYGTNSENYFIKSNNNGRFIQYHPKTKSDDSFITNTQNLLNCVNHGILLYPSNNTVLLSMNNLFHKRDNHWLDAQTNGMKSIYKGWGVALDTNVGGIPQWIIREWMSLYMMDMWFNLHEWGSNTTDTLSNDKLKIIQLDDLLYNFADTITELSIFLNIEFTNRVKLCTIHREMTSLQQHLNKDDICKRIIVDFLNGNDFAVNDNLSIVDEAWIQWELRNNGYEMYCNGLNDFPKNLYEFNKHTYKL